MKNTRLTKRIISLMAAMTLTLSAAGCASGDGNAEDIKNSGSNTNTTLKRADESGEEIEPAAYKTGFEASGGELSEGFRKAAFKLSAELFRRTGGESIGQGENVLVSPESVMLALGLAANGAAGDTLAQFETLFGGSIGDINDGLAVLISQAKESESAEFDIANSIWVREGGMITLEPTYAELCKRRLDAESFLAPFDAKTLKALNGWVSDKTKGMIPSIKDAFEEDEVAVLINCIAFEAMWNDPYLEYSIDENGVFRNAKGGEEKCVMLSSTENVYLEDDSFTGFMKFYDGGRYAFAALLPKEGKALTECVEGLDGEALEALLSGMNYGYEVHAKIPEFKFDFGGSIAKEIAAMGLDKAFHTDADFSAMAKTSTGQLFIGDIIHKTHIEVNRYGTKAAAATEIEMKCGAALIEDDKIKTVTLDRPFVMAIVDTRTSLPVFIGAVNSTEE